MLFQGKTAIITGAASGIGKATALKLGEQGANICVNYYSENTLSDAQIIVAQIEKSGGKAICVEADVTKIADVKRMFDETITHFGSLDILINNAAYAFLNPIEEITEEEYDYIFDVNVKGVFFACQFAAKIMNKGGKIINLSSSTTGLMLDGYGLYDATKGAVEVFSRILSKELGIKNISVNVISPGATETEQFRNGKSEEFITRLAGLSHFNRIAQTEEIANVISFFCTDESSWVTGQNIRVNGGTC